MSTLAEAVGQGAQEAQNQSGQTIGNAMQAYQISQTAEHARQELEMEKQKQDMNKATWVSTQLQAGAKLPPSSQKIWASSFSDQLGKLYPGAHPEVLQAMAKDTDFVKGLASTIAPSLQENPAIAKDLFGSDLATLQGHVQERQQQQAMISAAQLKNEAMGLRSQVMASNAAQSLGDKFDKDPNITKLVPMGQALGRDLSTITHNSPDHPVTYQTLHESLMNVANVLGSGSLSDSRVNSITPHVNDEMRSKIEQFFGDDPNRQADPRYVKYVQNLVTRLHGAVRNDVGDRADQIASGRENTSLAAIPGAADVLRSKHLYYKNAGWMSAQQQAAGASAPQAQQPQGSTTPYGSTPQEIEANYQKFLAQKAHQTAGGQ